MVGGSLASIVAAVTFVALVSGCKQNERSGVMHLTTQAPVARTTPSVQVVHDLPALDRPMRLAYASVASELDDDSWRPLASHLRARLNLDVEPLGFDGYTEIVAAVATQQADLALLAPLSYVMAREQQPGLEPLVQVLSDGKTSYSSYLFVSRTAPYHSPEDLRGARVAFVDEYSTSGFLLPYSMLLDHGIDPETELSAMIFEGGHVEAFQALAEGRADAVASNADAVPWAQRRAGEEGWEMPAVRLLGNAGRIPLDVLCAAPSVPTSVKEALRDELLHTNTAGAAGMSFFLSSKRIVGWSPTSDDVYDEVRQVHHRVAAHRAGIPETLPEGDSP